MMALAAPLISGIAGLGSTLLGGFLGRKGAQDQNIASAQQAQKQMDFQERMSNTARQREVEDLKKAGLNPMLAHMSGASSPSGAAAPVANVEAAGISGAVAARTTEQDRARTAAQLQDIFASVDQKAAQTELTRAQARQVADTLPYTIANMAAQAQASVASAKQFGSSTALNELEHMIRSLSLPRLRNEAAMQETLLGRVMPFVSSSAGAAAGVAGTLSGLRRARLITSGMLSR